MRSIKAAIVLDKQESDHGRNYQNGFTLVELIVALALLSLVSLFLFDAALTQWSNMQRISRAFAEVRSLTMREMIFRDVTQDMIPSWPESDEAEFQGTRDRFAGSTLRSLSDTPPHRLPLEAVLERGNDGHRLVLRQQSDELVLLEGLVRAGFDYRGLDGNWREAWPPEDNPGNGFFDDGQYYATPPLPETIRLRFSLDGQERVWIVAINSSPRLPFRIQDFVGGNTTP